MCLLDTNVYIILKQLNSIFEGWEVRGWADRKGEQTMEWTLDKNQNLRTVTV